MPASSDEIVHWHPTERQEVRLPLDVAQWLQRTAEAFDAIPFAWPGYPDGWLFVMMPRRPTVYV